MLFLHPTWDHESERLGKKRCTPTGSALHVVAEWIGFVGLLALLVPARNGEPQEAPMFVEVQVAINGPRPAIWAVMTDIEDAAKLISGIETIEVLEKPASGLVGLRWRETRMLFGKPATAEKWITEAAENEFYRTRAEDNGFVFISTMSLSESGTGGTTLTSTHDSQPQGFVARLMSIPMKLFFRGVARKALLQDLNDIKAAVERN